MRMGLPCKWYYYYEEKTRRWRKGNNRTVSALRKKRLDSKA